MNLGAREKRPFFGPSSSVTSGRVEPCSTPVPSPAAPVAEFRFDGSEHALFDMIANDIQNKVGTPVEWFVLDINNSVRDPLYDEPIDRVWKGPFAITGKVEVPVHTIEAREEGKRDVFDVTLWLTRIGVEESGIGRPKEGDVFRVWKLPFYEQYADEQGYFFDVILVDPEGQLYDTEVFVTFKIQARRKTEFTAERRIES